VRKKCEEIETAPADQLSRGGEGDRAAIAEPVMYIRQEQAVIRQDNRAEQDAVERDGQRGLRLEEKAVPAANDGFEANHSRSFGWTS
jgi:hypothetical protein